MKQQNYQIEASESFLKFEFLSIGPKGKIRKQVQFKKIDTPGNVFNLSFGDIDSNGEINDNIITNNQDSQLILSTVAMAVYKFLENHPNAYVFAIGSSKSRTRLYQIGISNHLDEIKADFIIYGLIINKWHLFEKGKSYEAFLVKRKISKLVL